MTSGESFDGEYLRINLELTCASSSMMNATVIIPTKSVDRAAVQVLSGVIVAHDRLWVFVFSDHLHFTVRTTIIQKLSDDCAPQVMRRHLPYSRKIPIIDRKSTRLNSSHVAL